MQPANLPVTLLLSAYTQNRSRPGAEGCLISVSRREAGSGARETDLAPEMRLPGRGGPGREGPGVRSTSAEGPDGPSAAPVRGAVAVGLVLNGSASVTLANCTAAGDLAEQTD